MHARWLQPSTSIRVRLALLVGGLLALITIGYSLAAYQQMRSSALVATKTRLTAIGGEWANYLSTGFAAESGVDSAAASDAAVQRVVISPTPENRKAAEQTLGARLPIGPQRLVVAVLSSDLRELARIGEPRSWANSMIAGSALSSTSSPATSAGELHAIGDSIMYVLRAPVVVDGAARGMVVEWRRLTVAPSPDQLNRLVGGSSIHVRLANQSGSVWSDLSRPIAAPHIDPSQFGNLLSYQEPGGELAFATAVQVKGLPWSVVVEDSHDELVALGRHFLDGLGVLGVLALVAGVLGAVWVSVSLTRPLNGLIATIEAVAESNYAATAGLSSRGDEIGRLARAFDAMVGRLQTAFAAARGSEELYRRLFEAVPLPCWVFDRETFKLIAVNEAAIARYGYSRDEFLSMTIASLRSPEDLPRLRAAIDNIKGDFDTSGQSWQHRTKDGSVIDVEVRAHALDFEGRPAIIAVIHDISERKQAAERIARLEERYLRLIREAPTGFTLASLDGQIIAVNPAFIAMLGYDSEAELLAVKAPDLYPDAAQRAALIEKMRRGNGVKREEIQLKRKDGSIITIQYSGRIVRDDVSGEEYMEDTLEDVTDQRRIEQQFYQAQKMDAVGRLAGGIAHDFNNLLTVILNYCEFLIQDERTIEPHREDIESIRQAARSAAVLTRQLLILSRQEVLQPQIMQLNDLVNHTSKLLQRLIGENIELVTTLDPNAGLVKADPGQVEQVIVNLAVNARDAMPYGGRLLIQSENVEFSDAAYHDDMLPPAGKYVMLAVTDDGIGMDRKTQAKVFEPFFTTKPAGRGTGLGLATVYGIVKQSNGFISLYSEPRQGTSFKIYLPRVDVLEGDEMVAPDSAPARGGTETILLVEDQAEVRRVTHRILEQLGYRVIVASDAEEALSIAARHAEPIDLLVTDIVLPGMNGRALAENVAHLRPAAKVLFMSGYTDDAIVRHGVLEEGIPYLEKPFEPSTIAKKVRDVLDGNSAARRVSGGVRMQP